MLKTRSTRRRPVTLILALALAAGVACSPEPSRPTERTDQDVRVRCVGGPKFDPAGEKNVGNGAGRQFIGGQCLGAADCASGCCALPCGICSGPGAQFQAGKQGCGFGGKKAVVPPPDAAARAGDATAMAPPPVKPPAGQCSGGPTFDPAGEKNVGNGAGVQFIGGQCLSAADCASGCCAFPCGICSGPGAQFQAGKQGCGFGGPR
jgi:hypothetical protein